MANANDSKRWLDWINQRDRIQCEWAVNYLVTHNGLPPGSSLGLGFNYIEQWLSGLASRSPDSNKATVLLIKNMRAAWSAKKNRSQYRGRKAYSYVMSADVGDKLRKLSEGNPINATLEGIINREYQLHVNNQVAFQLNLRSEKDYRDRLQQQIDALDTKLKDARNQIDTERNISRIVIETIKSMYLKLATQEILLRKADIACTELTDLEQAEAIKLQEQRFYYFHGSLRAEIAATGGRRTPKI